MKNILSNPPVVALPKDQKPVDKKKLFVNKKSAGFFNVMGQKVVNKRKDFNQRIVFPLNQFDEVIY